MIGALVVVVGTIVTLWTIAVSIRWLIAPGEEQPDHPKRLIMRSDR